MIVELYFHQHVFPSGQVFAKNVDFDKIHVDKSRGVVFVEKQLRQRSTTSHMARTNLLLLGPISELFQDYSQTIPDYSGLFRCYSALLFHYSALLGTIWRMPR